MTKAADIIPGKQYRVFFKERLGFTQNAIYRVHSIKAGYIRFTGYGYRLKLDSVVLSPVIQHPGIFTKRDTVTPG